MNQRIPGQLIGGRYRLTESINSGGMGQVLKAMDTQLFNRAVAIKLLHQSFDASQDLQAQLRRRFDEEAKVSTLLGEHPLIIRILDYGLENDHPYLVMEYLSGRDLGQLLSKNEPMDPVRVVQLGRQMCAALHHAHCFQAELDDHTIKGVIHRDIKPSNIFVLEEKTLGETIKILDFGIAKVISDVSIALGTQTTGFLGSVRYASPEQLRGEELDIRSDIYSLGVVLYRMLTGKLPLTPKTDSFPGWYEAHNYQPRQLMDPTQLPYPMPDTLTQVVMECLDPDPENRPASMLIVGQSLEAALLDPIFTPPSSSTSPPHSVPTLLLRTTRPPLPASSSTSSDPPIFSDKTLALLDQQKHPPTPRLRPAGSVRPSPSTPERYGLWAMGVVAIAFVVGLISVKWLLTVGNPQPVPVPTDPALVNDPQSSPLLSPSPELATPTPGVTDSPEPTPTLSPPADPIPTNPPVSVPVSPQTPPPKPVATPKPRPTKTPPPTPPPKPKSLFTPLARPLQERPRLRPEDPIPAQTPEPGAIEQFQDKRLGK